ncbi:MAG: hypothetical protein COA57_03450 [Flavobacteriales bacterium]|nr:MAG: hypothetical protein COA57_03450 [Flavobacteriales bacterium]
MMMKRFLLLPLWLWVYNYGLSQNAVIDPYRFIATLQFDGQDFFDSGEKNFPLSYTFNTVQDGNGDGSIDPDDALENLVLISIGDSIYGTGRTGLANRGPNDQRPAVYFHHVQRANYTVYEYWLYYADNDWVNDHEHDWEKYYVYVQDTTPVHVKISNHSSFDTYSWCEMSLDANHPIIGVDGGSHAMKKDTEDGVQIRYNGEISLNGGQLDAGAGSTIPWVVYSNDLNVLNVVSYTQSPDTFFYGDPEYMTNSNEYGDARDAPWKRSEWDDPPVLPIVYLGEDTMICDGESVTLDAGLGFNSYLWSNGSTGQTISVDSSGSYSIEATDNKGCVSRDTVTVIVTGYPGFQFSYSANGLLADFTATSTDSVSYNWDFGDGGTSNQTDPTHTYASPGTYQVCLIASNACFSDTVCDSITVNTVGISEYNARKEITVFPNPNSGVFELRIQDSELIVESSEITISNVLGETLWRSIIHHSSSSVKIDFSGNPKGIYFLKIEAGDKVLTRKFVYQ